MTPHKCPHLEGQPSGRPVARVAVDISLSHLDRLFDYSVPSTMDEAAVPGSRVKVRFAGKLVGGFVVERVDESRHSGKLATLAKVVSSEPVLSQDVYALSRSVADRYAGTLSDVLRLAIPPRHARVEAEDKPRARAELPEASTHDWRQYRDGEGFVSALAAGSSPRACWSALPATKTLSALSQVVLATLTSGRGAIVCLPDVRDVARFDAVLTETMGAGHHVVLTAAQGPAARYRAFLALARGEVKVVVGTRAAAFAPVQDLGLVAIFDDGDDLFSEQRAPYPHAREVLLTRALSSDAGVLLGGYARSAEAQTLVESRWCVDLSPHDEARREAWPRLQVTDGTVAGSAPARLPHAVFRAIRDSTGPVLIQVPRRGYRSVLACQNCRTRAECPHCHGPLRQSSATSPPVCGWCGQTVDPWKCQQCSGTALRAAVVGQVRTAEEMAKAFGQIDVVTSGGSHVIDEIEDKRCLVLATPGAEPHVQDGYSLVILLDTWLMLGRPDLRVMEEAHRRWFNALSMAAKGAPAVAVGDAHTLQSLVRADPAGFAHRELAERREAHMPPAARLAAIEATPEALQLLMQQKWPKAAELLGPVPVSEDIERLIVRVPKRIGPDLAAKLKEVQAERSASKSPSVRVRMDPATI